MQNTIVTMKWSETSQKWLMYVGEHKTDAKGDFVYDFWDCFNLHRAFKGLNKEKDMQYRITIEAVEET